MRGMVLVPDVLNGITVQKSGTGKYWIAGKYLSGQVRADGSGIGVGIGNY